MFFLADVNLGSDISSYYGVIQMCVSPLLYREKSGLCVCVSVCVGCVCVCVCVLWVNSKGKYKMETIYELGVCAQNRWNKLKTESTLEAFWLSPEAVLGNSTEESSMGQV
jgi:hypothetical protein